MHVSSMKSPGWIINLLAIAHDENFWVAVLEKLICIIACFSSVMGLMLLTAFVLMRNGVALSLQKEEGGSTCSNACSTRQSLVTNSKT